MQTRIRIRRRGIVTAGLVLVVAVYVSAVLNCSDPLSVGDALCDCARGAFLPKPFDRVQNLRWGITGPTGTILHKGCFVINHDDDWKIPYWVGYYLSRCNLGGSADLRLVYRPDTALPASMRADTLDYDDPSHGYDHGLMAPKKTFQRSEEAQRKTFLLSNIAPQTQKLNSGRWRILEQEVRDHVRQKGEAWVFTGNLFLGADSLNTRIPPDTIGSGNVGVPSHCFKAILSRDAVGVFRAYAFVMPNISDSIPGSTDHLITVDRLEQMTGYDFFYMLPDRIENEVESRVDASWP